MKERHHYACQSCGYNSPRWIGKCPQCNSWNSFVEEVVPREHKSRVKSSASPTAKALTLSSITVESDSRTPTGIAEFDRVLGGGMMSGSVVLVGGDPGIGKSTLMLQMASRLSKTTSVLYITGEESIKQIKLRAERLGDNNSELAVLAETNLEEILGIIRAHKPDVVIIDSIQTMYRPDIESAPGSVAQVRESASALAQMAKQTNTTVFIVGHITKDGMIAGPKVLEHMVDTVLQFEGEGTYVYRILRAMKNRFGSTNEIGVFEMRSTGLIEVSNPSEIFLSERSHDTSGTAVIATMEGTRPLLVEVQALVSQSYYNQPQRTATGFEYRRLQMLLAVLEKRLGFKLGNSDVFVNVAGGLRIDETAADLGIALSIISSMKDTPLDAKTVAIGEIGLGGEVRAVAQAEARIAEATKLGFERIFLPKANAKSVAKPKGVELIGVEKISEVVKLVV